MGGRFGMNGNEGDHPAGAGLTDEAIRHAVRGEELAAAGNIDDAVMAFREAVSIDPGLAGAHHTLGLLLRRCQCRVMPSRAGNIASEPGRNNLLIEEPERWRWARCR